MTSKPHDALFKAAFEHPDHAAALFRHLLPPALVREVDWATLTLEPSSFVDPSLASRHGDLLFSASIGDTRLYFYVVLEHQSLNFRKMCLRALGYIVRKWEYEARRDPLPLAVAIVVSHAPEGWTSPVEMHELLSPAPSSLQGVAALVPGFRILVDDLAHVSNEELEARALAAFPKLVLWALRDARDPNRLLTNLAHWVQAFGEALRAPSGIEAVSHVLRYVTLVCQDFHY